MRVGVTLYEGTFFRKTNYSKFLLETLSSRFIVNLHLEMFTFCVYFVHDFKWSLFQKNPKKRQNANKMKKVPSKSPSPPIPNYESAITFVYKKTNSI